MKTLRKKKYGVLVALCLVLVLAVSFGLSNINYTKAEEAEQVSYTGYFTGLGKEDTNYHAKTELTQAVGYSAHITILMHGQYNDASEWLNSGIVERLERIYGKIDKYKALDFSDDNFVLQKTVVADKDHKQINIPYIADPATHAVIGVSLGDRNVTNNIMSYDRLNTVIDKVSYDYLCLGYAANTINKLNLK